MLDFAQNFPCFSIIICMMAGIITAALPRKAARVLNYIAILAVLGLSAGLLFYTMQTGGSFVYKMGRFPAPWGNELRAGALEAGMAFIFSFIMFFSMVGGYHKLKNEVELNKHKLYYIMVDLLLSSLLALVYTNDLFTAYVFVEINTISACGLIIIRQNGRTIEAGVRYMVMSLLGSGMLLMGICMLYDLTGHLLMENVHTAITYIVKTGTYQVPLIISIGMMTVGLAIKSALFPFHAWLPDAYGYSTVSSAAILSSLVSKGYIFLLIKIFYRVIGFNIICGTKIINVLFAFGLCGMIFGSVSAILEKDIRRMIAFSSVAQIGYIYMGFGLGTTEGMTASIYHILAHAATKSLLFIAAIGLTDVSGGNRSFFELSGSGYRNKIAGVGFTVGSLSMVGIPFFAGFVTKYLFAEAAIIHPTEKMLPTLVVLAISTILNAIYFLKTTIRIYTPEKKEIIEKKKYTSIVWAKQKAYSFAIVMFVIFNMVLGLMSEDILYIIQTGLRNFA
ncbi:MAG: proton-conducting transporter membrane subunit [Eubacteriales bacterium]|nr:proton-conducting transporter membrane subunit [Eubacteriales bacterium]